MSSVGSISLFAGTSIPVGYALCDGSAVSRTTYSNLYTTIGDTYGNGDGFTTFNLPDLRGRINLGVGTGVGLTARVIGDSAGDESHILTIAEMPAHTH